MMNKKECLLKIKIIFSFCFNREKVKCVAFTFTTLVTSITAALNAAQV
jgi:hypothetical protein